MKKLHNKYTNLYFTAILFIFPIYLLKKHLLPIYMYVNYQGSANFFDVFHSNVVLIFFTLIYLLIALIIKLLKFHFFKITLFLNIIFYTSQNGEYKHDVYCYILIITTLYLIVLVVPAFIRWIPNLINSLIEKANKLNKIKEVELRNILLNPFTQALLVTLVLFSLFISLLYWVAQTYLVLG